MSDVMRGEVEAIRKDKGAIKVGDSWYNLSNVEKQGGNDVKWKDKVAFKFAKGKGPKGQPCFNITSVIKVEEKAPAYQGKGDGGYKKAGFQKGNNFKADPEKQGQIMRQSCLGYAATLVAATMSSKSDVQKSAELVVKIASEMFYPFAEKGGDKKPEVRTEEVLTDEGVETEEVEDEFDSVESEEEFDDDIPF